MTSSATLKAKDYGNEATRFGFNMLQITAANFDAQVVLLDNIQTAVGNVALGAFLGKSLQAIDVAVGPKATVVNAQREAKWRCTYLDSVQPEGNGSFEIGMPDLSLLVAGSGNMDVSAGAGAALVTAIEAGVVSRLGNAVTIDTIIHVGRNV